MSLLSTIAQPSDLASLSYDELSKLAQEIRERIINVTCANGGHIGPNLGVVELTLALHRVFDFSEDQVTFDVSHQGYVHKLLTGRNDEKFDNIRRSQGYAGFLSREESEYDAYGAGHAGTALSAALGMASARDKLSKDYHVVSVVGDAALTCGISLEALNNVSQSTQRMVVVLNDNEWSISKNVGAVAQYLNTLLKNPLYNKVHKDLKSLLEKVPGGPEFMKMTSHAKKEIKDLFVPSSLFEHLGIRYIGPVDGHDIKGLEEYLTFCRDFSKPIILHTITQKGRGYDVALKNPAKFHGTGAFDRATGQSAKKPNTPPTYQNVFGEALVDAAKKDAKVVGITAAMPTGTSLSMLEQAVPEQFIDVGIAEEHAVLYAAGLATQGMKPVCAIYSTFLQRAFDPIIHDVCLQNLNVFFCMDRAGLSPNDGPTHHGLFDVSYLRMVPNAVVMQPKDEDELCDMFHTGLKHDGPIFMRYPRGASVGVPIKAQPKQLALGVAEELTQGQEIAFWALGNWVQEAQTIADDFLTEFNVKPTVVNARFVKPLDVNLLLEHAASHRMIVTFEDNVRAGGFGSAVIEALHDAGVSVPVVRIGWPDEFVAHGSSVGDLRARYQLDNKAIKAQVLEAFQRSANSVQQAATV